MSPPMPADAAAHITAHRAGFGPGYTAIATAGEPSLDLGMDVGVLVLERGATFEQTVRQETCWVLLEGDVEFAAAPLLPPRRARRISLFDDAPTTLHASAGQHVRLMVCSERAELAVAGAANPAPFVPRLFLPAEVSVERRGAGIAQEAAVRDVRLVFDQTLRPQSRLVVGEVVTLAGRWSSYPPHHHPQPELYHYRFSHPAGFGHAELGESVFKVRSRDSMKILPGRTHAQVCAPGYAMWYLWVVRHLPAQPYTGFAYAPEHAWMLDPGQQGWRPQPGGGPAGEGGRR